MAVRLPLLQNRVGTTPVAKRPNRFDAKLVFPDYSLTFETPKTS
jgi:hypothetical protein